MLTELQKIELERRTNERRAVIRRAVDLHDSHCECAEHRRKAERRQSTRQTTEESA